MITFNRAEQIGLVRQPDHARLSRQFSRASSFTTSEPVELAIHHHDDGWSKHDETPKLSDGMILDYRSMPTEDHLNILEKSARRSLKKDPYAGWLVSRHGCSFHKGKTGEKVERFLRQQKNLRDRISQNEDLPDDREKDFNWLQFVDSLSLYVLDPWSETLEWDRKPPGKVKVVREEKDRYRYEGAGFEPAPCTFTVDCKYVTAEACSSHERLRNLYRSAETRSRTITIKFRTSTTN